MHAYQGNRIGLLVVGVPALAAGLYALLRGQGLLPGHPQGAALLNGEPPGHPLIPLLLIVLALLAVRWLLRAAGWGRCGRRTGSGVAMLGVGLKEVEGLRVRARIVGDERLRLGVACAPDTDVCRLVARLDSGPGGGVVSRARRAVGDDGLFTLVRLHVRRR